MIRPLLLLLLLLLLPIASCADVVLVDDHDDSMVEKEYMGQHAND